MNNRPPSLTQLPAFKALQTHFQSIRSTHLRDLFASDPKRGERLTLDALGIYLDYSKNRISDETIKLLFELARECDLPSKIAAMFRGDRINITEDRSVLHTALRSKPDATILVDGVNVVPEVHAVLAKMTSFCDRIRSGQWKGHTGQSIRSIVNIGIGGSDLGPVMAYEALKVYSDRELTFRFISNIDGSDFAEGVRDLNPAETLFIISSKTFTTLETMTRKLHAIGCWLDWAVPRKRSRSTLLPSRRMPPRYRNSVSTRRTCSGFGIGSAVVIRWIPQSGCRPC